MSPVALRYADYDELVRINAFLDDALERLLMARIRTGPVPEMGVPRWSIDTAALSDAHCRRSKDRVVEVILRLQRLVPAEVLGDVEELQDKLREERDAYCDLAWRMGVALGQVGQRGVQA